MTETARLQLGLVRPDGTRAAIVTDQGGLLVHGAFVQEVAVPAPRAAELPLSQDDIAFVLAAAARAPSVHNTQPWKFRICGNVIDLLADPNRMLHQVDPAGRELMISCGAALFGLRLGMRKLGYLPAFELLPDPELPWLVARVRPQRRAAMTRSESELLSAIPHRHTHRGAFAPGEIPARLVAQMRADAAAEGSELLQVTEPSLVTDLAGLVVAAAAEQQADARIRAELRRWVRPAGSEARDGVSAHARLGPRADPDAIGGPVTGPHERLPQRDFGQPGTESEGGVAPAVTAVLVTAGDGQADWLRAGQALHRLLLRAATRWVFASLQSQPLESARYRAVLADRLGLTGQHPQMLLQFGRANTALATARRPLAELMTDDQEDRPLVCP